MNDDFVAIIGSFFLIIAIFILIIILVDFYFLSRIFKKSGVSSWKAFIPLYNIWVLVTDVCKIQWWVFLLIIASSIFNYNNTDSTFNSIILICSLVGTISMKKALCDQFGKDTTFLFILIMFPVIGYIVLALGHDTYLNRNDAGFAFTRLSNDVNQNVNNKTNNIVIESKSSIKFCTNCGNKVEEGQKFCTNCGNKIFR